MHLKSELVVLVTGGRDYADFSNVSSVLSSLKPIYIIHGGATGADSLAQQWADSNNVITYVKKADWNKHGKAAGPIRNAEMLKMLLAYKQFYEVFVVAFPGGRGTKNMVEQATAANIPVIGQWEKS